MVRNEETFLEIKKKYNNKLTKTDKEIDILVESLKYVAEDSGEQLKERLRDMKM